MKTVHITNAHPYDDNQIWQMCVLSCKNQFEIFLIVNDGSKTRKIKNVNIVSASFSRSNLKELLWCIKTFLCALKLNADIYHMHDPELIPFGLVMRY